MAKDAMHIMGSRGEISFLERIYRVDDTVAERGRKALKREAASSYQRTKHQLKSNPELQKLFAKSFVDRIDDWDVVLSSYFKTNGDPARMEDWEAEIKGYLEERDYSESLIREHLAALKHERGFVEFASFLYEREDTAT